MGSLTQKTTLLLSPHEHRLLLQEARRAGTTMGELIRRAIRKIYMTPAKTRSKASWKKLFQANAPVGEWSDMEKEILRGRLEN